MSTHVQSLPHHIQAPPKRKARIESNILPTNKTACAVQYPGPSFFRQVKHDPMKIVINWEEATKTMNVAGMTRIESLTTHWKPKGGQLGDWALIYPILKEKDAINDDSDFWYLWDYDTGTKKRMNGIAARQMEAGYQHIKQNDWAADAPESIYGELCATHKTFYRLSQSFAPASQKSKQHICMCQIDVQTGFQRLLERFPPETTEAKIMPGFLGDFWVKGGGTHFQQTWDPSLVRFVIDGTLADNRQEIKKNTMKLFWGKLGSRI